MRFIILFIITFLNISYIFIPQSFADCQVDTNGEMSDFLKRCSNGEQNSIQGNVTGSKEAIKELVIKVSKKVISFGALFAIGAIVYSGIQYTTLYGDDEKAKKAKNTALYALMGLLLLVLAYPLVNMTVAFFYGIAAQ